MFQYKISCKYLFLVAILFLFELVGLAQNIAADKKVAFVNKSEINKMHVDGELDEDFGQQLPNLIILFKEISSPARLLIIEQLFILPTTIMLSISA